MAIYNINIKMIVFRRESTTLSKMKVGNIRINLLSTDLGVSIDKYIMIIGRKFWICIIRMICFRSLIL